MDTFVNLRQGYAWRQGFPDAVNHPNFPSQIVSKGKPYTHSMPFEVSNKLIKKKKSFQLKLQALNCR